MKKLNKEFTFPASQAHSDRGKLVVIILTIALFILSAGAPSATTGIGK